MHPYLNIAITAARKAGDYIMHSSENLDRIYTEEKQAHDYVTDVDRTAEKIIIDTILQAYPQHSILAEESGELTQADDTQWIIDPLDGTTNFIHGFPHYAVSIGVRQGRKIEHGVIYDPVRNDLFTASRGQGAQLNNRRMRVSQQNNMDHALLGTGFPFRCEALIEPYMKGFQKVIPRVSGIRRAGSAALDMAYVAAGHLDAYWEMGLNIWDIAAGVVLIREAGGFISDLQGGESHLETGDILVGNPKIFKQLLQILKSE